MGLLGYLAIGAIGCNGAIGLLGLKALRSVWFAWLLPRGVFIAGMIVFENEEVQTHEILKVGKTSTEHS